MGSKSVLFPTTDGVLSPLCRLIVFPHTRPAATAAFTNLRLLQAKNRTKKRSGGVARAFGGLPA